MKDLRFERLRAMLTALGIVALPIALLGYAYWPGSTGSGQSWLGGALLRGYESMTGAPAETADSGNATESHGLSELHVAGLRGDVAQIRALLAGGAEVDGRDAARRTPLHLAALVGNTGALQELLRHGAAVNARASRGRTPLYLAATAGRTAIVELLLRSGADPQIRADNGMRPVDAAKSAGQEQIVDLLTRLNAGPTSAASHRSLPSARIRIRA